MTNLFLLSVLHAQIAQLVEQRTENPRVAGSIPALGTMIYPHEEDGETEKTDKSGTGYPASNGDTGTHTCGINSVVECHLAKVKVASPNLVSRSKKRIRRFFCTVRQAGAE